MRVLLAVPMLISNCQSCGSSSSGPSLASVSDAAFEIPAGSHDSSPGGIDATRVQSDLDRFLSFQARFSPDAAYITADPANQGDWNKLMGLTTVNIHGDSLRLGWRYAPASGLIELGLYAYVDGARVDQLITSVPLDTWLDATLLWTEDLVHAEVNGVVAEAPGPAAYIPRSTWVLRTAYFGGDETAPQDIHVDVRDVWTDP